MPVVRPSVPADPVVVEEPAPPVVVEEPAPPTHSMDEAPTEPMDPEVLAAARDEMANNSFV